MRPPSVGQLNRVLKLCSAGDVITDGEFRLARTGIRDLWAKVSPVRPSSFSPQGMNAEQRPTHRAITRALPTVDLTVAAWAYEARTISADLWYKIVGYRESEDGQWWEVDLQLYSREDQEAAPNADLGISRKQGIAL